MILSNILITNKKKYQEYKSSAIPKQNCLGELGSPSFQSMLTVCLVIWFMFFFYCFIFKIKCIKEMFDKDFKNE